MPIVQVETTEMNVTSLLLPLWAIYDTLFWLTPDDFFSTGPASLAGGLKTISKTRIIPGANTRQVYLAQEHPCVPDS